jgi:hypothetical protein
MEYKFTGKISLEDFVQYNRFYMTELFFKRKTSIIFIIAIIFFIGSFIFSIITFKRIRLFEDILPIILFCLVLILIIRRPKIFYKKYFNANKISHEEQQFSINEKEMNIKSESLSLILTKEKINKIKFDKDSIYIFTAEGAAHIIKSKFLNSIIEFNNLKDFIRMNYIK